MNTYHVKYDQAVWERCCVTIEATSAEEAEEKVLAGEGDILWCENKDSVASLDIENVEVEAIA